jgi:hypothetical protein
MNRPNRNLRFSLIVVAIHTLTLLAAGIAGWTGWYKPPPIYDDVFRPYLFISGPISFYFSLLISHAFYTVCIRNFSIRVASILLIWVLPGFFNAVLGGIQWFVIADFLSGWICGFGEQSKKGA